MLPNPLFRSGMPAPKLRRLFASFLPVLACLHFAAAAFGGEFVVFSKTYVRGTGAPETVTDTFDVLNPGTIWTMQVENGSLEDDAVERVSSSTITMNGVELLHESDFNQNVEAIQLDVNVLASNTIAVKLRGKPGGRLIVKIVGEDNVAPTVQWDAPLQDEFTNEDLIAASLSLADDISGPDPATLEIQLDGTSVAEAFSTLSDPTLEATLLADLVIGEGLHSLSGQVRDLAGQLASASVSFTVDRTAPVIAEVSPPDGATVDTAQPTISASFGDPLTGIDVTSVRLILDGTNVTAQAVVTETSVSFTPDADLADGTHTAEIQVADRTGNLATAGTTFAIVTLSVAITSPGNPTLTNQTSIDVSGTVSDSSATVEVNGMPAVVTGGSEGTFVATGVPVVEGNNILTATARRGASIVTASVTVIRDTTPPNAVIESPTAGQIVTTTMVTVVGTVNDIVVGTVDAEDCSVVISGPFGDFDAQIANRTFIVADFPLAPGPNTITAVPTDTAGNTGVPFSVEVTRQVLAGQQLRIISGNNQTGVIEQQLPEPIVVQAVDAAGNPLTNRFVTFRVVRNNGELSTGGALGPRVTVLTDAAGQAAANWTMGNRSGVGNNRVEVSATGFVAPVLFCASATAGDCDMLAPNAGATQVGAVGEPLPRRFEVVAMDAGGNACPNVPVTFTVQAGAGNLGGGDSITVTTNTDGMAATTLTLGPEPGINNNVVTASFPGLLGLPVTFTASGVGVGAESDTTFAGVVLDTENRPIPGATLTIEDTDPLVQTTTDENGLFTLVDVPVGSQNLFVDGSTSTRPGPWPFLEFQVDVVSGIENTLGMPIFLPQLDADAFQLVGGDTDVVLTMAGVEGFSMKIFANSVTFPNGDPTGFLGVTQVSNDQVPMPPMGGAAPPWVGTLQPAGVILDPPAQLTVPNSLGLPPGQIVNMFSFDHDLNQFVGVGTGTVQPDGATIVSDPGSGIRKSGWFWDCPPPPPPNCASACDDGNVCNGTETCVNGSCVPGTNAALCTVCTPAGRVCDGNGNCELGRNLTPQICGQLGLTYANQTTLACPGGTCGAGIRFDITAVTHSCDNVDLVGAPFTEVVTNDHGCFSINVQGGPGCPIGTGNVIAGCTDTYQGCGPPALFPLGTCQETITQQLFVGTCLAETRTIVITITRTATSCTATIVRN